MSVGGSARDRYGVGREGKIDAAKEVEVERRHPTSRYRRT